MSVRPEINDTGKRAQGHIGHICSLVSSSKASVILSEKLPHSSTFFFLLVGCIINVSYGSLDNLLNNENKANFEQNFTLQLWQSA